MENNKYLNELKLICKENGIELNSEEASSLLDSKDELASFRNKFHIPKKIDSDEETIYFCGNSLGLQPKSTEKYVLEELKVWQEKGVEGHFDHPYNRPWVSTDEYVLQQLSNVVGAAKKEEVVAMNSLTVNLHLLMVPFYQPNKNRNKILIEQGAFPSDLYAVESQIKHHGYKTEDCLIQIQPKKDQTFIETEDILKIIEEHGDSISLVLLAGIQYYTGQYFEIEKITKAAKNKGCNVGWDLAHAVGNVDVKLHDWDVDFAVWCSYKYLNSGPGAIGGAFLHEKYHSKKDLEIFQGWWGHSYETRFQMHAPFDPIPGAFSLRLSNPAVLCIATLLSSLEIFEEATMKRIRKKSLLLTTYFEYLVLNNLKDNVKILTPNDPEQRGAQISLYIKDLAKDIHSKLTISGVICDYRHPDVIRLAPAPLYNTFQEVRNFVQLMKEFLS